jgi:hypothetical protein
LGLIGCISISAHPHPCPCPPPPCSPSPSPSHPHPANASAIDIAQVTLIFLSIKNSTIFSITTSPQGCIIAWCYVTGNCSLSVGTRTIDYRMTFVANWGSYVDAWIYDNALNVASAIINVAKKELT